MDGATKLAATPARRTTAILIAMLLIAILLLAGCAKPASEPGGGVDQFLHPPTKAPTPTLLQPLEIDLSGKLDAQGKTLEALRLEAPDGCMGLEIDAGVAVLDPAGKPVGSLTIAQNYPLKLPVGAYGVPASFAYRFGPQAVSFSQPVKMVFHCLKNYKKTLVVETSVGIQGEAGEWDQLSVQGDERNVWTRVEALQPELRYLLVGPAPMGS